VIWNSNKQKTVAKSTCEAEYTALLNCVSEVLWVKSMLIELGFNVDTPVYIGIDNHGAKIMAENASIKSRVKHIDIKHHFIIDHIKRGNICLKYVLTETMPADILTKGVGIKKLNWSCEKMKLRKWI
jgi:hypothetical protein